MAEAAKAAEAGGVAGVVEVDGAWLPIVALHDAYSTGIEWHRYRSACGASPTRHSPSGRSPTGPLA